MEKNKVKVLFFDIDGTLFDTKNNCIPLKTIESFKILKEKGYIISIATGRCFAQLDLLMPIKEYIDYYILANGQHIIDRDGKIISENPYSKEELDKLIYSFNKFNLGYGLQGEKEEIINIKRKDILDVIKRCKLPLPKVDDKFYATNKVYQAWVVCCEETVKVLRKENPSFIFVPWIEGAYDIMLKGIDKSVGVKKIISMFENVESYAFGDNYNDEAMLDLVDYPALIKNSHFNEKKEKYFLSSEVDKDGLYEALQYFSLI